VSVCYYLVNLRQYVARSQASDFGSPCLGSGPNCLGDPAILEGEGGTAELSPSTWYCLLIL
jgi:hypothetical protein